MQIVITHLTRMAPGYFCAAGIDLETGRQVRPVMPPWSWKDPRLCSKYLQGQSGFFDMGVIVDLGKTVPVPRSPEVEDTAFDPEQARLCGVMTKFDLYKLIKSHAKDSLTDIFGDALIKQGRASYVVQRNTGSASLGFLRLNKTPVKLSVLKGLNETKIRLLFKYGEGWLNFSVTDIRLYASDCTTPDDALVQRTADALRRAVFREGAVLGVGLTRLFAESPDAKAVHWLQVNNLHFNGNPVWRMGERKKTEQDINNTKVVSMQNAVCHAERSEASRLESRGRDSSLCSE